MQPMDVVMRLLLWGLVQGARLQHGPTGGACSDVG
jgi:hypothetical protein